MWRSNPPTRPTQGVQSHAKCTYFTMSIESFPPGKSAWMERHKVQTKSEPRALSDLPAYIITPGQLEIELDVKVDSQYYMYQVCYKLTITDGLGIFRCYILISQICTELKIHFCSVSLFFENVADLPSGLQWRYLLLRVVKCRNRIGLWSRGRDERPKTFNTWPRSVLLFSNSQSLFLVFSFLFSLSLSVFLLPTRALSKAYRADRYRKYEVRSDRLVQDFGLVNFHLATFTEERKKMLIFVKKKVMRVAKTPLSP